MVQAPSERLFAMLKIFAALVFLFYLAGVAAASFWIPALVGYCMK